MPLDEGGFTKLPNGLLEALYSHRIPGQEMRVVLYVIRKTIGFSKDSDAISYGQIAGALDIPRTRAIAHVQNLVSKKILTSTNNGTRKPATIRINMDFSGWTPSPKKGTSPNKGTSASPNNGNSSSPNNGTHKRKKETYKENYYCRAPSVPDCAAPNGIPTKAIVDHLNSVAGTQFKHTTAKTKALIKARFNEGFVLEDFKTVIDAKWREWRGNAEMVRYIRPETLFGTKFEGYLMAAKQTETKRERRRLN